MTQKLSLVSGYSANPHELQNKLENFYDTIKSLEEKIKQSKLDIDGNKEAYRRLNSSPVSVYSGLSGLESAFGEQSVAGEVERKRMSDFMKNLDTFKGKLDKGPVLQSQNLSEFSIDEINQIRVDDSPKKSLNEFAIQSPNKSVSSIVSDWSTEAFNQNAKLSMNQVLTRMYG